MSNGVLHDFDTALTVVGNDVASDVGLTVRPIDYDTVVCALLYLVPPNKRHTPGPVIISNHLDSILVRLGNLVVKQLRFVVLDLNCDPADLNLILHNVSVNIKSCDNARASAEPNLVSLDLWPRCNTLNEDSRRLATHDDILRDNHIVLRLLINHDGARVKMSKGALMDGGIALQRQDASSVGIVESITLKVTVEDLDACIWHRDNAGDLAVGLSGTSVQTEDAVVHFEDSALYHDNAVHVLFDVKFPDAVLATVLIELHMLLVCFHVELLVGPGQHHLKVVDRANLLRADIDDDARLALLADCDVEGFLDGLQDNARFPNRKLERKNNLPNDE